MTLTTGERIVAETRRWLGTPVQGTTKLPKGMWAIYALTDPRDGRVRYIGYSARPRDRLLRHLSSARLASDNYPVHHWMRKLMREGVTPQMLLIEVGAGAWQAAEKEWIAHFRQAPGLLNVCDGGGNDIPAESRKRAGDKMRGRSLLPEHCEKIAAAKRGKRRPDAANFIRAFNESLSPEARSDHARRARSCVTDEGKTRMRETLVAATARRWAAMTAEDRAAVSERARIQMRRVWQERKEAKRDSLK